MTYLKQYAPILGLFIVLSYSIKPVSASIYDVLLCETARHGDTEIENIKHFIEQGANVNMQDPSGRTPLMWAAFMGHNNTVNFFLSKNANLNVTDKYGRTALMWAVYWGHTQIVRNLLNQEADCTVQDEHGKTATMLAEKQKHIDILHILQNSINND